MQKYAVYDKEEIKTEAAILAPGHSARDTFEMLYERGEWYIVDTQIANKLGVKGSNEYIDTFDPDSDEKVKLALVDYKSGAVYVFDMNGGEMQNIKEKI